MNSGTLEASLSALGLRRLHGGIDADTCSVDAGDVGFFHPLAARPVQVIGSAAEALRPGEHPPWQGALPKVIVIGADAPTQPWLQIAQSLELHCFANSWPAQVAVDRIRADLAARAASQQTVHATLIEILGLGVLLLGASGSGKSELALDLVARGHRLVADDAVELSAPAPQCLLGSCPAALYGFIEVRGIGVLDLRAAYGARAVVLRTRIDLAIRIDATGTSFDPSIDHPIDPMERINGRRRPLTLLDTTIPEIVLPARLGHNAVMVEAACRDHWLRCGGYVACEAFAQAQDRRAAGEPLP